MPPSKLRLAWIRFQAPALFAAAVLACCLIAEREGRRAEDAAPDSSLPAERLFVSIQPGAPEADGWVAFFACTGLDADLELVKGTLLANRGRDTLWADAGREAVEVEIVTTAPADLPDEVEEIYARVIAARALPLARKCPGAS